jgi:N-acetylmuramoyl-L-alanine amidase
MPFQISNNLLNGPTVSRDFIAKKNKVPFGDQLPDTIIIHFTAGRSAESSAKYLADDNVQASAHIVIGRNGKVFQLAPFDIQTWHAGISNYQGRTGWNKYSIGIEIDNPGPLTKTPNGYVAWFKDIYPEEQVVLATHRHETTARFWHTFTPEQIAICEEMCLLLIGTYPIKQILGHEEISKGRKTDPGPAFPLDKLREKLLSDRNLETPVTNANGLVITDKLNIRSGAAATFPMISAPLSLHQHVTIIDEMNGWYKVKTEIEGWVNKAYVKI